MSKMHYIVISQTIDLSTGMVHAVGFIGVFHDLQKALDAGNAELRKMNVPDYYYLIYGRESSGVVTVDSDGKYVDDVDEVDYENGYGIMINVVKAEENHIYTNEERVV